MNKYRNKKTVYDGYKFDSIVEKDYYKHLKRKEEEGLIKNLTLQKRFILQPAFKHNGKTIRAITYTSDFYYITADGQETVIDVKGVLTAEFKIKLKLMRYIYKDLNIILIGKRNGKWVDLEAIKKETRKGSEKS